METKNRSMMFKVVRDEVSEGSTEVIDEYNRHTLIRMRKLNPKSAKEA